MKLGSTTEVIAHGKTGFLCNNVTECVSAINKVTELDRYACRQHVQDNFSFQRMTDGYEEVYRQILQQKFAKNGHVRSTLTSGMLKR